MSISQISDTDSSLGLPYELSTTSQGILRGLGYIPLIGTIVGIANSIIGSIVQWSREKISGSVCLYNIGRGVLESLPGVALVTLLPADIIVSIRKNQRIKDAAIAQFIDSSVFNETIEEIPSQFKNDSSVKRLKRAQQLYQEALDSKIPDDNCDQLKKLAAKKDIYAQLYVGILEVTPFFKYSLDSISETGLQYLQNAAQAEFATAQFLLARYYAENKEKEDLLSAQQYYTMAAEQKYAKALYELAIGLKYETLGPRNREVEIRYLEEAVAQNYVPAKVGLAEYYTSDAPTLRIQTKSFDFKRDYKMGITPLGIKKQKTADRFAESYLQLWKEYSENSGKTNFGMKDNEDFYIMAAERKNARAQVKLADYYLLVEREPKEEVERLYSLAAEQGYAKAQYKLAAYYEKVYYKTGEKREEILRLYQLAAEQGYAKAQYALASYYETIAYTQPSQNTDEIIRLYTLAAEQGYIRAQTNLADLYVRQNNIERAVHFYKRAAAQGCGYAINRLQRISRASSPF